MTKAAEDTVTGLVRWFTDLCQLDRLQIDYQVGGHAVALARGVGVDAVFRDSIDTLQMVFSSHLQIKVNGGLRTSPEYRADDVYKVVIESNSMEGYVHQMKALGRCIQQQQFGGRLTDRLVDIKIGWTE